jgi:hypothetical protein
MKYDASIDIESLGITSSPEALPSAALFAECSEESGSNSFKAAAAIVVGYSNQMNYT